MASSLHEHKAAAEAEAAAYEAAVGSFPDGWGEEEEAVEEAAEEEYFGEEEGEGRLEEYTMVDPGLAPNPSPSPHPNPSPHPHPSPNPSPHP